ncbi:MAG: hypothetical protein LV480_03185 [Methylacidiphilales bacterium]|nr:hypothetical protein [Candidatus Methylacidiphilales bacterium]
MVAVIFVTAGRLLLADAVPVAPPGYHMVPVKTGDKTAYVQVSNQTNPYSNLSAPEQKMFSRTSALADQKFVFPTDSLPKSDLDFKDQNTFITKPYVDNALSSPAPNIGAKASFATTSAYSRSATGFDKNYPTSNSDIGQNRTSPLGSTADSADQNHTAQLGGPEKPETLATSSMAHKQYLGPGARHVPDGVVIKENIALSRMSSLPNRPLSIDEVRNLINHDAKPDTDVKPDEPSKPLNDPDYKPEPLREMPPPSNSDDDKNDPVPPPGTMAAPQAPENSEPLPQQ